MLRVATVTALGLLLALGVRWRQSEIELARQDRALSVLTASDSVNLRLAPAAPGVPEGTHARYRGRAGSETAVITCSSFPPLAAGDVYQVWVRHAAIWTSLGTVAPDAAGSARLIAEAPVLAILPDARDDHQGARRRRADARVARARRLDSVRRPARARNPPEALRGRPRDGHWPQGGSE